MICVYITLQGNFRLLKLLLSKGANCREKDNEGQTALHLCTRHKSPKCLAMLLRQLSPGEIDDQDRNKVGTFSYTFFVYYTGVPYFRGTKCLDNNK